MHLSKSKLYRLFFENMHCGVNQYISARRIDLSRELLAQTALPVGEICERVGLGNYTYFCRLFKKKTGRTPLQYRKNR
jgi:two-component system response regulator YesN